MPYANPVTPPAGKEVVIRYSSDVGSRDAVYTDANGREMLRRERDRRPTWDLNVTEPVAGNFYPVRSLASIALCGPRIRERACIHPDPISGPAVAVPAVVRSLGASACL